MAIPSYEDNQSIYISAQLRAQLENCQIENQRLLNRIETLEKEVTDLTGELQAAEDELDAYEQMDEFGKGEPEDNDL